MKQKDLKIITYLRKDARIPLTKLSKATHIPVSTIFDRIKSNEKKMIIRHTSLLNFAEMGYNARANIILKVDKEDKETLRTFLLRSHDVNSVCKINNGYDFMIEGIFKQVKDMEDFMDELEAKFNIQEKNSFFVIEELKRESFMSEPDLIMLN